MKNSTKLIFTLFLSLFILAVKNASAQTTTFNYTGALQTYTVSAGVSTLTVTVAGAQGGEGTGVYVNSFMPGDDESVTDVGGNGGNITGILSVIPGSTINIYVGGMGTLGNSSAEGTGGYNGGADGVVYYDMISTTSADGAGGGGGGGASDIRVGGITLADRVVAAGGGGGGGVFNFTNDDEQGGPGGASTTALGAGYANGIQGDDGYPGDGGTQVAGGDGGFYTGYCTANSGADSTGGTGCSSSANGGGGGGGGYFGGGGGVWAGGGGGSSYIGGLLSVSVNTSGTQSGNGVVTITAAPPTSLSDAATVVTEVSCSGGNNGSVTVTTTGGTAPYTYLWSDPASQTTQTATDLTVGTYSVLVTDNTGLTGTASVSLTQPSPLGNVIATVVSSVSCTGGSNGSATVNPSGSGTPYTYLWSNGEATATATGLSAGTYSVSVTDACGADSLSKTITISQPDSLSTVTISAANITCNGGTVSATANVSGGTTPYTYLWSNGEATATATGLVAGTYSVSVKDACGADSLSKTITITQPSPLGNVIASVTSNITCNGTNSGSAMVSSPSGGTTPYTYMWSDASSQNTATATGLSAGTYNVSVMDACGTDSVSATITITQPAALGVETSISQVISCNGTNGDLVATVSGGNTPYTYTWTPSGGNASGATVTAGTYTITVNDGCGATATSSVILTQPVGITSTGSVTQEVGCNGGNNGIATVSASGGDTPYTYTWSDANSQSTASATGLVAGTYTVNITDPCEDEASSVVIISQPAAISVVANVSGEVTCYMSTNGSASSSVSGGATPYTYSWSGSAGRTNATVSGLGAGTYILTVTDANGCSQTSNVITITQPSTSIETSASTTTNVLCNGDNSGSATSSATGGTTPYTYAWTGGGGSNAVASNLIAGNYTVTITDNGGCSSSASIVISQPSTSLGATTYSTQTAQGACDGTAAVTASGGVTPYTYLWNNPGTSTTDTIKNQCFGTFCCEITDANGCTASICVQVDTINTTGINSITNANNINIYPNPTIGSFTISGVTQGQVIELYNYIGEKISSTVVSNNTTMHFDISNRANGVYMIRILNTDGTLATEKKMIKTQ